MRRRNEKHDEVIIKRRIKRGHTEGQGGAWKVAFADFALAMMALFMVLWIVQPQADKERLVQANEPSSSPVVDGGAGIFDGSNRVQVDVGGVPTTPRAAQHTDNDAEQPSDGVRPLYDSQAELESLAQIMQNLAKNTDALSNLEVQVVPQGLRILIKDDAKHFMFERGSASLNPHFQVLLDALTKVLGKVQNKLIISGHTDATPYRKKRGYDNWNLSGERALRARNVLIDSGLSVGRILQVSAQADGMPLRPLEPENGANRRIEILLLTSQAEALYQQLFSADYVRYSTTKIEYIKPVKASL